MAVMDRLAKLDSSLQRGLDNSMAALFGGKVVPEEIEELVKQEAQDSLAAAIPFPRRLGQADEFASLALHMIDNPYLNGEVVRLDAALRMAPR